MSFISCLLSPDLTLDFWSALAYSIFGYLWLNCLASSLLVNSFLRLVTLIKVSEEAGIQWLGSDDHAIKVIRSGSFLASSGVIFTAVVIINSYPAAVPVLMGRQEATLGGVVKQDPGSLIYFAIPTLSFLISTVASLVRLKTNRMSMEH